MTNQSNDSNQSQQQRLISEADIEERTIPSRARAPRSVAEEALSSRWLAEPIWRLRDRDE